MTGAKKLTEGSIFKALFRLALPIMGTSFVHMAYNMTDMLWVGKIGYKAVASVGTAGFYTWLAMAPILLSRVGVEVGVAQSIGAGDSREAKVYIKHSIQITIFLGLLYGLILLLFRQPLIGFFNLGEERIVGDAADYLRILSPGMLFFFLNPILSAVFYGAGDSKTPFLVNSAGLVVNMILDPLLILGIGPFPRIEVAGAALATVIAAASVTVIFIVISFKRKEIFSDLHLFSRPDGTRLRRILKLGSPPALQSALFTGFAMIITRIVAGWGSVPVAAQEVGTQIEAISWMTSGGFQTAMSAFVGQNHGAKKCDRIYKGYFTGMSIMIVVGLMTSALLIFAGRPVFTLFIKDPETVAYGVRYLRILGFSQLFMCIEATSAGAFSGLGRTLPPSIIGISFNALRIPLALLLSSTALGLDGVWWSISISSILKGAILSAWYVIYLRRSPNTGHMKLSDFFPTRSRKTESDTV